MLRQLFENVAFHGHFVDSAVRFSDCDVLGCSFDHCRVMPLDVNGRPSFERILVQDCNVSRAMYSSCHRAIFRDIHVVNLSSRGETSFENSVFERVVLSGKFDNIVIQLCRLDAQDVAFADVAQKEQIAVDWALDISQAEFREIQIAGIPARLVRRDPETQAVLRRARLLESGWDSGQARSLLTSIVLNDLLEGDAEDALLIAPKRDKKMFPQIIEIIRQLRADGIADPE